MLFTPPGSKFKSRLPDPDTVCTHCGAPMDEADIFCKQCYKISPRVKLMLDLYPERHRLHYVADAWNDRYICPHCKTRGIFASKKRSFTPIVLCPRCKEYFLSGFKREIYLLRRSLRIYPLIQGSVIGYFLWMFSLALLSHPLLDTYFWLTIPLLPIALIGSVAHNYRTYRRRKAQSERRFAQNPEYLQMLYDMGV